MSDPFGNYQANLGAQGADLPPQITFFILTAGNPNLLGTVAAPDTGAVDYVNNVLYFTTDGSTWTTLSGGGGGGTTQVVSGNGNPSSTPTNDQLYVDTATLNLWSWTGAGPWKAIIGG